MKNYIKNWNIIRFLRVATGIAVLVQGILIKDWLLSGLGGLFTLMPLMNAGCGVGGNCNTNYAKRRNSSSDDFTYEEVK